VAKETYPKARERLFKELVALGYTVTIYNMGRYLKVPYVHSLNGQRYDFHPQSVHEHDGQTSMWIDIRGMSATEFDREIRAQEVKRGIRQWK
jgi:predicted nucleotidyltransferase